MTDDPLDQLRLPDVARRPDPRFAASLRARIEGALATPPIDTTDTGERSIDMPDTTSEAVTATRSTLIPYIAVSPAAEAIAWYGDVFGAVETLRYTGDDGRVGHAELDFRGAMLMLADGYPEIGFDDAATLGGTSVTLHLTVPDVDAVHQRAVDAGATADGEPADRGYGARSVTLRDPFGHRWMVQTPIGTPTIEETQSHSEGYTITEGGPPPSDS